MLFQKYKYDSNNAKTDTMFYLRVNPAKANGPISAEHETST
jgi:hypothetical protein